MIILHGENIVESRLKLNRLTSDFKGEVRRFNGEKAALEELLPALESPGFFANQNLIVLENFFSRPAGKEKDDLLKHLKDKQPANLIIWNRKTIDGRILKSFTKAKIFKFEIKPQIFKMVEAIWPGNAKNALIFYHSCLKHDPPERIMGMIIRQIRLLLIAKDVGVKGLTALAPWQRQKLSSQAEKFSLSLLLDLYRQLLTIDEGIKTGQNVLPLKDALDLYLAAL